MLKTTKFLKLLNIYEANILEKHLVSGYIKSKQLNIDASRFLSAYLGDFIEKSVLADEINTWIPTSIKELENYLELTIPADDRKLNGAFFTPSYIVDFIIYNIKPGPLDKNLDPSCGSGAFLVGLAQYYKSVHGKSVRQTVIENIYGSDIIEYNVSRAKVLLALYALEEGEFLYEEDFNLYHRDSLRFDWLEKFDAVIGNPPYVKFQDLSNANRDFLAKEWDTVKGGAFNLYFPFFELGYKLLGDNGKLAFITPNNYFTSLAGETLRDFFKNKKCVYKIIDFSHKKVFDALTYTAITFLDKIANTIIQYDRIEDAQEIAGFLQSVETSSVPYDTLVSKKWRLLKSNEVEVIKKIENSGETLGDLFDISVGIATLKDDIFFVDGTTLDSGYYHKATINGSFAIEAEVTRPVYKISDFGTQEEVDANTRRVIYPYYDRQGVTTPVPEQEMAQRFPECYKYLQSETEQLLNRDKAKVKFNPFYVWGRTQGLARKGLKLITPTFSQSPRFLKIEETNSYFTNGYALFYKRNLGSLFIDTSNLICLPENIDVLQKLLNSKIMGYYVEKTSVSIDGGYPCYQKNFIEKFTVPHFSLHDIMQVRADWDNAESIFLQKYQLNSLVG